MDMDSFENWDSDDDGSELVSFLDYSDNGWWVVGFAACENGKRPRVVEVLDQDRDINTLARRAVNTHGLDPERLIVSPIAAALKSFEYSTGMKI
jgi:hypothetical protein